MTIRELIAAAGMTQKAFGEYMNIPKRTVENWCRGVNECPEYVTDLIAYKLKKEGLIRDEH